jgi:hypothetical protein
MRTIPDPGFAGDDGSAPVALREALTTFATDPTHPLLPVLAALQDSRLLVPVVAVLGEVELDEHGLAHDKTSDMATVLMQGRDGRMALLAFSGTDALARWNPEGRPVPVTARDAASAALHDGAEALLLDVAGPVMCVVEGEDLRALAGGASLVDLAGRHAWAHPAPGPEPAGERPTD